jgi:hypothetical protein
MGELTFSEGRGAAISEGNEGPPLVGEEKPMGGRVAPR